MSFIQDQFDNYWTAAFEPDPNGQLPPSQVIVVGDVDGRQRACSHELFDVVGSYVNVLANDDDPLNIATPIAACVGEHALDCDNGLDAVLLLIVADSTEMIDERTDTGEVMSNVVTSTMRVLLMIERDTTGQHGFRSRIGSAVDDIVDDTTVDVITGSADDPVPPFALTSGVDSDSPMFLPLMVEAMQAGVS